MQRHLLARCQARLWLLALLFSCLVWEAPASAQVRNNQRGVTVFSNANFQGTNETFFEDFADLRELGLNDQISSIQIPRGEVWEICQDINYLSPCQLLDRSVSDLGSLNWNDKISSLRRVQGRDQSGLAPGRGNGARIFTDADYRGRSETFFEDFADLSGLGLNDQISSIEIPPGQVWEVCQDVNYIGPCQTLSRSVANFGSLNFNDRISSVRRLREQEGRAVNQQGRAVQQGRTVNRGTGARIFADPNYRGRSETVLDEFADLSQLGFNDQISSIEIPPGQVWEVCQDWKFTNRCEVLTGSTANLGAVGMNDSISSLRRLPDNAAFRGRYPYDDYGAAPRMTLYAQPGYRGAARVVDQARTFGLFGNRAASAEIQGGAWEVCQSSGSPADNCVTLTRSVPDLANVGLTGPITSARPVSGFGN